jgi:hypothetical protein
MSAKKEPMVYRQAKLLKKLEANLRARKFSACGEVTERGFLVRYEGPKGQKGSVLLYAENH